MLKIVELLKNTAKWFLFALACGLGWHISETLIPDPTMTMVFCTAGNGECERVQEPIVNSGLLF